MGALACRSSDERGDLVLFPFRDGPAARAASDGDLLLAVKPAHFPQERLDVVDRMLRGEVGEDAV